MPDFGGRFIGDAGVIQIDSTYRNFEIFATGNGVGVIADVAHRVDITFAATPEPPMLFVRTNNNIPYGYVAFQNWIKTGANYTGARMFVYGLLSFSWFVACNSANPSTDGWGIRVRDAAGKIVFDGGKRYLKIIDAVRVGVSNGYDGVKMPPGYPGYVTHVSTSDPYYCLGGGNGHISTNEQQVNAFGCIRNRDSTSVEFSFLQAVINAGAYTTYASASFINTAEDWIYEVPIIVGVLSV